MMIGISGKSTATSSIGIGCPHFRRIRRRRGAGADSAVARVKQHRQSRLAKISHG
jgi:hypothetical protein